MPAYENLFSSYLTPLFDRIGKAFSTKQDCENLVHAALYKAIKGETTKANGLYAEIQQQCTGYDLQLAEMHLFLLAKKKRPWHTETIKAIRATIEKFPGASFAKILLVEGLIQNKNLAEAQTIVHALLEVHPGAKGLYRYLVQFEMFRKNYQQAALYAEALPSGVSRSLHLFLNKFAYPKLGLLGCFSYFVLLAIASFFPDSLLWSITGLMWVGGLYVYRQMRDRVLLLWLFMAGLLVLVFSLLF
ncbi:MAG TPA: hypothetical protein PLC52_01110 [Anaerolineales bacterium]|nr:hypothetical protein [Anaerolineales bacterium]HRQ91450.1 hypothetical protein [Anaerolineales bacterium]